MQAILHDLRFGLRVLLNNRGFAAVAVLTLALGIGANVAIFSLVDAVILRPLPYPDPEQLVGLGQWRNQKGEGYIQTGVSAPNVADIAASGVFQHVAYFRWSDFNITEGTRPESVNGIKASAQLLPMFEVQPLMGRVLLPQEMEPGHDHVAVIGYSLWHTRYASDPAIVGKTIALDQSRYVIVGVMPASFRFTWDQEIDVFVPLVLPPEERAETGRGTSRDLQTQARLRAGISIVRAQASMDVLAGTLAREYPAANKGWGIKVEPLHAAYYRRMETPLFSMLGAVLFVLLIACANVANLLLARATGRRREIAIRIAMGATRRRLIAQLLTESLLLAACGGLLGLMLAYAGDRLLTLAIASYGFNIPNASVISIDWRVLLFSLAVTLATGLVFGLVPAWATATGGVVDSLKESGATTTAEAGRRNLRNALVVCEMAIALMLLTGAGLLIRTFMELVKVDLGIDPTNVVTMVLRLPKYKYDSAAQQAVFYRELMQKLAGVPGVKAAGAESGGSNVFFLPQGWPPPAPGQEPTASYKIVTSDLLRAMGTRLVQGREFTEHDVEGGSPVAIISETVAQRYWPHSSPLGNYLTILARVYSGQAPESNRPLEVVGVAKDVRNDDLWRPEAAIYVPFSQHPSPAAFLVVRTTVPPMSVVPAVRDAVQSLDKDQPVTRIRTMNEIVAETYGALRFPMILVWVFSTLALVLSAVGIFGVMSYAVNRRRQEMALRVALGASRRQLLSLVLQEGLWVTLFGVVFGLAGALILSRLMAGYVYGITSADPLTFAVASLLLAAVALLASYLPARRAARVDPVVALRYE